MERIHHREGVGEELFGGGLEPGKYAIATTSTPSRQALGRLASHCVNAALERHAREPDEVRPQSCAAAPASRVHVRRSQSR